MSENVYELTERAIVEGGTSVERFSFDFKPGKHRPKSEVEEEALKQAVEAEAHRKALAKRDAAEAPTPETEETSE